jgi:hypothetical protein
VRLATGFSYDLSYSGRLVSVSVQDEANLPGFVVDPFLETAEEKVASIAQERAQMGSANPNPVDSPTTIACTALKDSTSPALSNEDKPSSCDESSSSLSVQVTVKRGTEPLRVTLYERAAKWEGYGLVTQATTGLKGVYVYVSKPVPAPLSVTCVWHEHNGGYVKGVYMANLMGLSGNQYTYTLEPTLTDPVTYTYTLEPTLTDPVTMEVPKGAAGPFDPTQEQIDAVACAALGSKFTGEALQCTPPVSAETAYVTVMRNTSATPVKLYRYTQPASFWAGYGRAANSGVYVKISSTGDVTCVWDSGASGQKVEYKSARVPSASASTSPVSVVYILTSGTENVTLVHTSGPSPFPPVTPEDAAKEAQKQVDLAETTAAACNELKTKLNWVVCDSTSALTSNVIVTRGTAAGVLVTLRYDLASKSWAGYGLSTGSAGTGPKGLYVAVSIDAQGVAVVKCVWDTTVPEVGDYRATVQDRTARIYALVTVSPTGPTSVVKEPVSVLVTSGQSPFPSEKETPKPVAPAPAPASLSTEAIIGIVVGSVVGFILIVVLVVLWVRSRKNVPDRLPLIDRFIDNFRFPR